MIIEHYISLYKDKENFQNIINKINNEEITNDRYYEYAESVRGKKVAEYIKKEMGIQWVMAAINK